MSLILSILVWILTALLGVIVGLIIYARWNYGFLEGLGIPVVKPFLFLGSNYNEAYVDLVKCDIERQRKYGGIYGVYDGRRPQIYVSDPKLIRLITTADFDNFANHGWIDGIESDSIFYNLLDFLKDEKWKTVRGALTPIFTSGKLKQLIPMVKRISEDYVETLLRQCKDGDGRVNQICFREFVAPMVIECLAKCFCGIEIPNAKDEDNQFIINSKMALLHDFPEEDWKSQALKIFPLMNYVMPAFEFDGLDFFVSLLKNVLEAREKSGEASIDATSALVDMMKKSRADPNYKRLGISENVVLAQAWEFFNAGYTAIRDLFYFFMYEMASDEQIQRKVYEEIEKVMSEDQDVSLEAVSKMPYLSACLKETSRLNASFHRIERMCNKDWSHEGIRIPKGTQVVFPILAIHRDPELYPNPDTFDPTRFMPENKDQLNPYAYMAFGQGPRSCIGQRFAMEVMKIFAVVFLLRFKIQRRPDTICEAMVGGSIIRPYKPLFLDVLKR